MLLKTIEVVNKDGRNTVINESDLELWKKQGYQPVGESADSAPVDPKTPATDKKDKT